MKIGVPREVATGECRVAIVPAIVAPLKKLGLEAVVEANAGAAAYFGDAEFVKAGALIAEREQVLRDVDLVASVQRLEPGEVDKVRQGAAVISFLPPATSGPVIQAMARRQLSGFSMDLIPRISRAQSMDALSSQATVSGYKAVLIAAESLSKFFPMLTTAAGTIFAAKVLVLGAGVAGLQAIATARRLGAIVFGYDVRPAVREQVESLGAKFLEFELGEKDVEDKGGYARQLSEDTQKRQQQWLADKTSEFDVVITTALIPGKPAPRLITRQTVERMRPGSVIVDLAGEAGGNCELTRPGGTIEHNGVIIHAPVNLPSLGATHASQMFARNVFNLVSQIVKDGKLSIDTSDDVIKGALVTHQGQVVHETVKAILGANV